MWPVYTLLLLSVLSIHEGKLQPAILEPYNDLNLPDLPGSLVQLEQGQSFYQPSSLPRQHEGRALQCFSCVGANDQECNRQGSQQCSRDSDACAIIRGQTNGVMKSCSFKSFCDRAVQDAAKTPGISVQCCFSNNCNSGSQGSSSQLIASYIHLLVYLVFGFCLLFAS